jgi:hypothetical protein
MSLEHEVWKAIPGFPHYEASSMGRVRMLTHYEKTRNRWGEMMRRRNGRILQVKPGINTQYFACCILDRPRSVHRMVAMAFHGVPADGLEVNHINGIKTDNRPENLEWVTRLENVRHSIHVLGRKGGRITIRNPKNKAEIIFEGCPFSNAEIKAKALHSRRVNYDALCVRELEEYNEGNQTHGQMAEKRGISRRTMWARLKQGRKVMSSHE